MPKKTLAIGATLADIYVRSTNFHFQQRGNERWLCQQYGSKLAVDETKVTSGGGASNVAVGLARLGFNSSLISEMGRDHFATIIEQDLSRDNVNTELVIKEKLESTGISIILVGADGERTVLVDRGASALLDDYDIPVARVAAQDWVHITSLNGRQKALKKIFKSLNVCKTGFSWNPGAGELELIAKGDLKLNIDPSQHAIFFVNREEWESIKNKQTEINQKFATIVITDGRKGGYIYQQGVEKWFYHGANDHPLDTTGAGDSFATGFVAATLRGANIPLACEWGRQNAANVVRFYGAKQGLLNLEGIDKAIQIVKLKEKLKAKKAAAKKKKSTIKKNPTSAS